MQSLDKRSKYLRSLIVEMIEVKKGTDSILDLSNGDILVVMPGASVNASNIFSLNQSIFSSLESFEKPIIFFGIIFFSLCKYK